MSTLLFEISLWMGDILVFCDPPQYVSALICLSVGGVEFSPNLCMYYNEEKLDKLGVLMFSMSFFSKKSEVEML